jgi:hypothetical protein
VAEPVVKGAVAVLRVGEECEVALRQTDDRRRRIRFAAGDDQTAGDVVGAVAVRTPHDRVSGVFEQSGVVGQPDQVREGRRGWSGTVR